MKRQAIDFGVSLLAPNEIVPQTRQSRSPSSCPKRLPHDKDRRAGRPHRVRGHGSERGADWTRVQYGSHSGRRIHLHLCPQSERGAQLRHPVQLFAGRRRGDRHPHRTGRRLHAAHRGIHAVAHYGPLRLQLLRAAPAHESTSAAFSCWIMIRNLSSESCRCMMATS